MKLKHVLAALLVCALLLPLSGCNRIIETALGAVASSVPKLTEAAADGPEKTTPIAIKGSSAGSNKKPTVAAEPTEEPETTEEAGSTPKPATRATARPIAARTPVPTVSADDPGSEYLPVGSIILSDDFGGSSSFPEIDSSEYEIALLDGSYQILIFASDMIVWGQADTALTDFVAEVTGVKVSGPTDGDYGIMFRYQDPSNFYVFKVAPTGEYNVSVVVADEWQELIPWTTTDAINTDEENIIAVAAVDTLMTFYINGQEVNSLDDDTFTSGDLALFGSTYDEGDLDVRFTNFTVWEYDESTLGDSPASGIDQGDELLSEDFTSADTGWDEWETESSTVGYRDGQYIIEVYEESSMIWGNAYQEFDDFIMLVEVTKTSGSDDNAVGLVFRYQDTDNFYVFAISTDGQYTFGYYLDNEWVTLVDWTYSDLVNTEDAMNVLGVACKGSQVMLAINDTVVERLTDDTFSYGDIGLLGAANSEGGVYFAYDNLMVWAAE